MKYHPSKPVKSFRKLSDFSISLLECLILFIQTRLDYNKMRKIILMICLATVFNGVVVVVADDVPVLLWGPHIQLVEFHLNHLYVLK